MINARDTSVKLKIGIVGFGTFGQFLAKRFTLRGHSVLATSRQDYFEIAKELGVEYFTDANDFCEAHPDVSCDSLQLFWRHWVYGRSSI